jgi:hypothetical protein
MKGLVLTLLDVPLQRARSGLASSARAPTT